MASLGIADWHSEKNEIFLNPRTPDAEKRSLESAINSENPFRGHVWLATSGSSGHLKWVILSKDAILSSAQAVNSHLQSNKTDIWCTPLPLFHIGGLAIHARSFLSGAQLFEYQSRKWHPQEFYAFLNHTQATLTSLVPAQVFDLVSLALNAPPTLRAVIVGGGELNESIYHQAVALGWKLLPSYGLTECASQVATASLSSWESGNFPSLAPLSHITLDSEKGRLKIKSHSLLTVYANKTSQGWRFEDPKKNGWFLTEDESTITNGQIRKITRSGNFIKIGGENVDLHRLENIFEEELINEKLTAEAVLVPLPDERLGYVIHLATTMEQHPRLQAAINRFHERVFPYERIRKIHYVKQIPRSPIGKLLRKELRKIIL